MAEDRKGEDRWLLEGRGRKHKKETERKELLRPASITSDCNYQKCYAYSNQTESKHMPIQTPR